MYEAIRYFINVLTIPAVLWLVAVALCKWHELYLQLKHGIDMFEEK